MEPTITAALIPTEYAALEAQSARNPLWYATYLWLKNMTSGRTRGAYLDDLTRFQAWLLDHYQMSDLTRVKRDHIMAWRDAMSGEGKSPATIARRLAAVGAFYKEMMIELVDAQGEPIISVNPADPKRVKRPKVSDESPRGALLNTAVQRLLASPKRGTLVGARDYAILSLLAFLALRRAEIAGLLIGDVGEDGGYHTLRVKGKGDKVRTLPIPPEVWDAIRVYLRTAGRIGAGQSEPLFIRTHGNGEDIASPHLSKERIWQIVKYHARRAEIPLSVITTHTLRHTALTRALEKKAPLHRVQYFAGHSDPRITMRYAHRQENLKESAVWQIDYGDESA